jgi:hypothetical protein
MIRKLVWLALIGLLMIAQYCQVQAQSSTWSEPLNISRSGAAEQPRLVAAPDGRMQAFWWDRFNGLTTAFSNGSTWTEGVTIPLDIEEKEMPEFVLDTSGRIHAFWRKEDGQDGGQLWHASMRIGESTWAVIELLASSTLEFKFLALDDGGIVVAYLRVAQSWGNPAGIYLLRLEPGVFIWNTSIGLDTSAYYRLENPESAWLHLAADGDILTVTWREPHSGEYMAKTSVNGGWTWGSIESLSSPGTEMTRPRSLYLAAGNLLIWQDQGSSDCTLIQRSGDEDWQAGVTGLTQCPQNDSSWSSADRLFWTWGEGSRVISLAAWDGLAWSQPLEISFTFTDPLDNTSINLQDLHPIQAGERLYVLGSDGAGEIWFLESDLNALQLLQAPRPDWGLVSRLSSPGIAAAEPAIVVDAAGVFHIVWLEGSSEGVLNRLYYAKVTGSIAGQPVAIMSAAAGEFFRQPALLADPDGWLHLAWSGSDRGEIQYSRVRLEDAENPGAWSPVQRLSTQAGAFAQLTLDAAGRLYLLYVQPLNEDRGVYLLRSSDHGDTWSQSERVFDAQAAGWANLGSAALAIAPSLDGGNTFSVHVAWGEEALPGTLPPQGIWYARASASLLSNEPLLWSTPFEVAGEQAAWPRLLISGGDVHLIYAIRGLGVWDRSLPIAAPAEDVSGWSTAAPATGWDSLRTTDGRAFGVAASGSVGTSGGMLHLVGMPADDRLVYSSWEHSRWGDMEGYTLAGWTSGPALWVDAASLSTGGRLGLTWLAADETGLSAVYWVERSIPVIEVLPEPTPMPTPVPQDDPDITPTPTIQPSPTPDLNLAPAMSFSASTPLVLGGGLAALLVVSFLLILRRSRRK